MVHVAPSMTPEKKLLYQVIIKLKIHLKDPTRTEFNKVYVSSIKDEFTIDLKRQVLDNSMNLVARAAFIVSYRLTARSFVTALTASQARLYIGCHGGWGK